MFFFLVKFVNQETPVVFGATNVYHDKSLASMAGVEWVTPAITQTGHTILEDRKDEDRLENTMFGVKVKPITPEPPF